MLHQAGGREQPSAIQVGVVEPFRRGLSAASLAAQLQLDGVDAGCLVGPGELDELGVVVDVGVVAGPDVVGLARR